MDYVLSPFRDFESYLRISTSLNEDDIQILFKQYNSKIITYKYSPAVYTFKDLSEALSRGLKNEFEITGRIRTKHKYDRSNSIIIESDNATLITKMIVNPQIHALRFDNKSFLDTILGFSPYWNYKSYDNEYLSEKNRNLSTIKIIDLKWDCNDSIVLNGVRQPVLYRFVSDKPPG